MKTKYKIIGGYVNFDLNDFSGDGYHSFPLDTIVSVVSTDKYCGGQLFEDETGMIQEVDWEHVEEISL